MLGASRKIKSSAQKPNDGLVELSFTLSVPANQEGIKLAERYAKQHRFEKIVKIDMLALSEQLTQFTVLAESSQVLKVPEAKKTNMQLEQNSEYQQIIARAKASVSRSQHKKRGPEAEETPHIKPSIVAEMVEQKTEQAKAQQHKGQGRNRSRRRRGRRSQHKGQNQNKPQQAQTNSSQGPSETSPVAAAPHKTEES